jgi:hypothetical protein
VEPLEVMPMGARSGFLRKTVQGAAARRYKGQFPGEMAERDPRTGKVVKPAVEGMTFGEALRRTWAAAVKKLRPRGRSRTVRMSPVQAGKTGATRPAAGPAVEVEAGAVEPAEVKGPKPSRNPDALVRKQIRHVVAAGVAAMNRATAARAVPRHKRDERPRLLRATARRREAINTRRAAAVVRCKGMYGTPASASQEV